MINGDAISHICQFEDCTGALSAPVSASVAHLKVNGTTMVATLAISSSTTDQTTRIFRSARSPGQMYGHRCASVPTRVARSNDGSAAVLALPAFCVDSASAIEPNPGPGTRAGPRADAASGDFLVHIHRKLI